MTRRAASPAGECGRRSAGRQSRVPGMGFGGYSLGQGGPPFYRGPETGGNRYRGRNPRDAAARVHQRYYIAWSRLSKERQPWQIT